MLRENDNWLAALLIVAVAMVLIDRQTGSNNATTPITKTDTRHKSQPTSVTSILEQTSRAPGAVRTSTNITLKGENKESKEKLKSSQKDLHAPVTHNMEEKPPDRRNVSTTQSPATRHVEPVSDKEMNIGTTPEIPVSKMDPIPSVQPTTPVEQQVHLNHVFYSGTDHNAYKNRLLAITHQQDINIITSIIAQQHFWQPLPTWQQRALTHDGLHCSKWDTCVQVEILLGEHHYIVGACYDYVATKRGDKEHMPFNYSYCS